MYDEFVIFATGSLAFSAGVVLLTFTDCENWVYLVIVLTAMAGLHGLQYCSSMVAPIDECQKYATVVMAFSQTVAQTLKIICVYMMNFFTSEVRSQMKSELHDLLPG